MPVSRYLPHHQQEQPPVSPPRERADSIPLRGCYSPRQAAEYLSLSEAEIYKLLGRHEIPSWKHGKCRRISKSALDAWIAERELESNEAS